MPATITPRNPLASAPAVLSQLLTPKQLATLTGLSVSTLAKQRLSGTGIPFIKLGAAVRYRESDVLSFLAALPVRRSTSEVVG